MLIGLGCAGCPYGSLKGETEKELGLLTGTKKQYTIDLFKESYDILGVNYNDKQRKINLRIYLTFNFIYSIISISNERRKYYGKDRTRR